MTTKMSIYDAGNCQLPVDDIERCNTYDTSDDDSIMDNTYQDTNDDKVTAPTSTIVKNDGNCLPTVQEIHQSDDHYHRPLKERYLFFHVKNLMCCFIFVAVILLLIVMAIFASNQPSSLSMMEPNTTEPLFTANYNRTMEYFIQNNISSPTALLTYGTPQYFATSYIANQLQLPVPSSVSTNDITMSTINATAVNLQQTYRYVARYVLALDYFHFTTYNLVGEPPQFYNFITGGMDICKWHVRTDSNTATGSTAANHQYDITNVDQIGVTCSMSTKLPIKLTLRYMNVNGGTLPTENGLLTSLKIFNMEHNDIIGTIPTELGQLTNLLYLNLGRNMLTGSIPAEIGQLSNLEYMSLRQNAQLNGSLPSSMAQLTSLQENLLDGTSVTLGINQMCRADGSMVVYTDCDPNNGGNYSTIFVGCECCRCCNDIDKNGTGCPV